MIPPQNSYPRLAVIACYFGKLPNYFLLVVRSISRNPEIDWHLFTDDASSTDYPPNLHIHKTTLDGVAQRLSNASGIKINLGHPYELCSMRPAFGDAFSDVINIYDYWAYSDLDVIFGNIRSFLPTNMLQYDRVWARGHLSFFRNKPEVNRAYLLEAPGAISFAQVASQPSKVWQFDEWPGIWKIMRYHRFKQYHEEVIGDIHPDNLHSITRFDMTSLENYTHQFFYWLDGKVFQGYYLDEGGLFDRELAYIHFQKRSFPDYQFECLTSAGFSIGPQGFIPYSFENLTRKEMHSRNHSMPRPLKQRFARLKSRYIRALKKRISLLRRI